MTIATNMAGRGTDILLGGNPEELAREEVIASGIDPLESPEEFERAYKDEYARAREICAKEHEQVVATGGLTVIGTERHESRRIDNQLRGAVPAVRATRARPSSTCRSRTTLMRLFGGDRMDKVSAMMVRYDMPDDQPIQNKMISKAVEGAQRKVESINFSMRKNVLEYDDVMNKQRQVIYAERNKILDGKDLASHIDEVMDDTVSRCVQEFCAVDSPRWRARPRGPAQVARRAHGQAGRAPCLEDKGYDELKDEVMAYVKQLLRPEGRASGATNSCASSTRRVMLRVIDTRWMNYLQEMDYLKQGIGLRGFGQRDPLVEYKSEAFAAFHTLVDNHVRGLSAHGAAHRGEAGS